MVKRVQSPSSINTFLQCPRKYYYQYIEKLPTKPSIHTVRGNIAHSTLEHFYALDVSSFTHYEKDFKVAIQKLFLEQWTAYKKELSGLIAKPFAPTSRASDLIYNSTLLKSDGT